MKMNKTKIEFARSRDIFFLHIACCSQFNKGRAKVLADSSDLAQLGKWPWEGDRCMKLGLAQQMEKD